MLIILIEGIFEFFPFGISSICNIIHLEHLKYLNGEHLEHTKCRQTKCRVLEMRGVTRDHLEFST